VFFWKNKRNEIIKSEKLNWKKKKQETRGVKFGCYNSWYPIFFSSKKKRREKKAKWEINLDLVILVFDSLPLPFYGPPLYFQIQIPMLIFQTCLPEFELAFALLDPPSESTCLAAR
jgi:hypothetical protein